MARIWVSIATLAMALPLLQPGDGSRRPLVIGHRGASGYRPEHTIESYALAIAMGADVIEPDLVSTRDGVLVARHENEIGETTDVQIKYPDRRMTRTIDGQVITGWFTEDFSLAELQTLRAKERLPFRSHAFDGRFNIPTFEQIVELAAAKSRELKRPIAVYPETKHPSYFRSLNLALEPRLVAALEAHGLRHKTDPVFIQSFEPSSLQTLRPLTGVRLVQLLDEDNDASPARLADIARYADGIGPNKRLVVPAEASGRLLPPTALVANAHAAGLFVHVWTMRPEAEFLSPSYGGDPLKEYRQFAALGVDGIFTDVPDQAVAALRLLPR
jgi:glycerophosphoryl diester phosphodiesterase